MQRWAKVPCEVLRFDIRDDLRAEYPFNVELLFQYEFNGRSLSSRQLRPDFKGSAHYEELAELRAEFLQERERAGSFCRVNPENPLEAVLTTGGFQRWAGLLFAGFGGCFFAMMLTMARLRRRSLPQNEPVPGIMVPFGLLFTAAGVLMLWSMAVPSLVKFFRSGHWERTEATVIWSRVKSQRGSKGGTTYSPDIFYRYRWNGQEYRSNTLDCFPVSSSGYEGKQAFVQKHLAGSVTSCLVNPEKPWQALLMREWSWSMLLVLFPLPFLVVGIGVLAWVVRKRRSQHAVGRRR